MSAGSARKRKLIRMRQQRQNQIGNQVNGSLEASDDQQENHADELVLLQAITVLFCRDQCGEDVVTRGDTLAFYELANEAIKPGQVPEQRTQHRPTGEAVRKGRQPVMKARRIRRFEPHHFRDRPHRDRRGIGRLQIDMTRSLRVVQQRMRMGAQGRLHVRYGAAGEGFLHEAPQTCMRRVVRDDHALGEMANGPWHGHGRRAVALAARAPRLRTKRGSRSSAQQSS